MMDWIFGRYSAISYSLLIALTAGALFLIGAASVFGLVIALIFFSIFLFGVYEHQQKGSGIRDRGKVAASGKIVSAYDIVRHGALGADWINMARHSCLL
ncbi:MAG: hypothetical protein VXY24_05830 [Pseudomonadota bacterium]|nr:hypothetical protein [Pseudomonadota bacterium]